MNLPSILILILIGAALIAALRFIKRHPSDCSGNCANCSAPCRGAKNKDK